MFFGKKKTLVHTDTIAFRVVDTTLWAWLKSTTPNASFDYGAIDLEIVSESENAYKASGYIIDCYGRIVRFKFNNIQAGNIRSPTNQEVSDSECWVALDIVITPHKEKSTEICMMIVGRRPVTGEWWANLPETSAKAA